jgi:hypothetical protein
MLVIGNAVVLWLDCVDMPCGQASRFASVLTLSRNGIAHMYRLFLTELPLAMGILQTCTGSYLFSVVLDLSFSQSLWVPLQKNVQTSVSWMMRLGTMCCVARQSLNARSVLLREELFNVVTSTMYRVRHQHHHTSLQQVLSGL